jgi:hypothetical protein
MDQDRNFVGPGSLLNGVALQPYFLDNILPQLELLTPIHMKHSIWKVQGSSSYAAAQSAHKPVGVKKKPTQNPQSLNLCIR